MNTSIFSKLSQKYPDLQFALSSPDDFLKIMTTRFENQKNITPENPYLFDYSELALPVVNKIIHTLQETTVPSELLIYQQELLADFLNFKNSTTIPYAPFYQKCYFFTRLMGLVFEKELSFKEKTLLKIDRILEGFAPLSAKEEYALFKSNEFNLLQKFSPVGGFYDATKTFGKDYSDSQELKLLFIPVFQELGIDVLMALANYPIFLLGITVHPEAADGFVRPSGDFWMHDVRHSSTMYHKRLTYEKKYSLNSQQKQQLTSQIIKWQEELVLAHQSVLDANLKEAIAFVLFNTHHDRGVMMTPSSYLNPLINYLPFALLSILKISKQPVNFNNPIKNLFKAYAWLRKFWLARQNEERLITEPLKLTVFII